MKALALISTLKKSNDPELSNTAELTEHVFEQLRAHGVETESIRLADKHIEHGLLTDMNDDWKEIAHKLLEADIVIFATPIWWGQPSSLHQKIIERMDDIDNAYAKSGKSKIYGKVAGIVITGHEDGALHAIGTISTALTWFGFTLPPESTAYWVGEVGIPLSKSTESRRANPATKKMISTLAHNLYTFATILKGSQSVLEKNHSAANMKEMSCETCKKAGMPTDSLPKGWRGEKHPQG